MYISEWPPKSDCSKWYKEIFRTQLKKIAARTIISNQGNNETTNWIRIMRVNTALIIYMSVLWKKGGQGLLGKKKKIINEVK